MRNVSIILKIFGPLDKILEAQVFNTEKFEYILLILRKIFKLLNKVRFYEENFC